MPLGNFWPSKVVGLGTGKMVLPRKLCGSARWSRHRKDGVPKKL